MVIDNNKKFNGSPPDPDDSRRDRVPLDPTFVVRVYLVLRAASVQTVLSSDDALLPEELHNRRLGNPKLVGRAVAFCKFKGWIQPVHDYNGCRLSIKSARRTRSRSSIELWKKTELTIQGLNWAKRSMTAKPAAKTLFDEIDGDQNPDSLAN